VRDGYENFKWRSEEGVVEMPRMHPKGSWRKVIIMMPESWFCF